MNAGKEGEGEVGQDIQSNQSSVSYVDPIDLLSAFDALRLKRTAVLSKRAAKASLASLTTTEERHFDQRLDRLAGRLFEYANEVAAAEMISFNGVMCKATVLIEYLEEHCEGDIIRRLAKSLAMDVIKLVKHEQDRRE